LEMVFPTLDNFETEVAKPIYGQYIT